MTVNVGQLNQICGSTKYEDRKTAFLYRLYDEGAPFGMTAPEVVAQIVAQVAHESGRFRYVREVWGPTAAQKRYEGRADLGNTKPGDGIRYLGRDLLQVTGRANHRALTAWLRSRLGTGTPDFEAQPELLEGTAWLGIGVVWYFATRKTKAGKSILEYCREGNIEMVSRMVNGGTNGLDDRLDLYTRAALVMLGRGPTDVSGFQKSAGLVIDGIAGPATRAALHRVLVATERQATPISAPPKATPVKDGPTPAPEEMGALRAFFAAILYFLKGR